VEFAPGMAAMLGGFGPRKSEVLAEFRKRLEKRFGDGPVILQAKAFVGIAQKPV
jgi:hypothetical protein